MSDQDDLPDLEIALKDGGVSLTTFDLKELARLLRLLSDVLSSVAPDPSAPPTVGLVAVEASSAHYLASSTDPTWPHIEREFMTAVRTRGQTLPEHAVAAYSELC